MELEANDAYNTILATQKRKQDEILIQRWIPYQGEMSFDDFKNRVAGGSETKYDSRSTEEILINVKDILDKARG